MIRLKKILFEDVDDKKHLNVLVVSNDNDVEPRWSFYNRLTSFEIFIGELETTDTNSSKDLLDSLNANISENYDLVIFYFTGKSFETIQSIIGNLQSAIRLCHELNIPIILNTIPTLEYSELKQDKLDYLNNVNHDVNMWIEQSNADYVLYLDKIINKQRYFQKNGLDLNAEGNSKISKYLLSIINSINPIDSKNVKQFLDNEKSAENQSDTEIQQIQKRLLKLGYYINPEEIESQIIGNTTKAALKRFQKKSDIAPTGKINNETLTALNIVTTSIATNSSINTKSSTKAKPGKWQDVMKFLIDNGITKEGAAGIAGNIKVESNFNPGIHGDNGTSYGICQWHKSRKENLFKFAKQHNAEPYEMDIQLDFLMHELNTSWKSLLTYLKTTTDAEEAAYKFADEYEIPTTISPLRQQYAKQYADSYEDSDSSDNDSLWSNVTNFIKSKIGNIAGFAGAAGAAATVGLDTYLKQPLSYTDISSAATYPRKDEKLKSDSYFIVHHTAGRSSARGVVDILNKRKLGVQWVVDREGNIYQTLPLGGRGAHILNSALGPNNSNSQGVEVVAKNDADVLPIQAAAVLKLVKSLGYSPSQIYGHGVVNPGHKQATEGATIVQYIKDNWNI